MAMTQLDSGTRLIAIGRQKIVAWMPTAHPVARLTKNTGCSADAVRQCDLPVVLSQGDLDALSTRSA